MSARESCTRQLRRIRLLDRPSWVQFAEPRGRVGFHSARARAKNSAGRRRFLRCATALGGIFLPGPARELLCSCAATRSNVTCARPLRLARSEQGRPMPSPPKRSLRQTWLVVSCIGTQLPHAVHGAGREEARSSDIALLAFFGRWRDQRQALFTRLEFCRCCFSRAVLFVCQNNQFRDQRAVRAPIGQPRAVRKGSRLRHSGERVTVNRRARGARGAAIAAAAERVAAREGPCFSECVTYYRVGPHSPSNYPSRYRDSGGARPGPSVSRSRSNATPDGRRRLDDERDAQLRVELTSDWIGRSSWQQPARRLQFASLFDDRVYAKRPPHLVPRAGRAATRRPAVRDGESAVHAARRGQRQSLFVVSSPLAVSAAGAVDSKIRRSCHRGRNLPIN